MKSLGKTKKKVRTWCPGGGKTIGSGCACHNDIKKFHRCPVCGQRFEPHRRQGFAESEPTFYMPKHKAY